MVQFNLKKRELSLKIVFYGPPLSGKTTNLKALFAKADRLSRGRLVTLDTQQDRTIFFDLLPISLSSASGHRLSLKLYTVPGQPIHNATRRVVLRGVDGVAFIASARRNQIDSNTASWQNYRDNLEANDLDIRNVPTVIQFNKSDLADIISPGEMQSVEKYSGCPVFAASAINGSGCLETVEGLMTILWKSLSERKNIDQHLALEQAELSSHIKRIFSAGSISHG